MESTQGITEGGMWRLVTGVPDARLCEGVLGYRGYWLAMNRPQRRIEVPNATVTMAINFGDPVRVGPIATAPTRVTAATRATAPTPVTSAASLAPATVVTAATSYTSLVNGLRTDSVLGEHEGRLHGVEVHFAPWMAYTVFGTDMHELRSRTVPLVDLLGPLSHQLEDRLAQAPCWRARFALMDALLLHRLEVGRAAGPAGGVGLEGVGPQRRTDPAERADEGRRLECQAPRTQVPRADRPVPEDGFARAAHAPDAEHVELRPFSVECGGLLRVLRPGSPASRFQGDDGFHSEGIPRGSGRRKPAGGPGSGTDHEHTAVSS